MPASLSTVLTVRVSRDLAQRLAREARRQRRPRGVVVRDLLAAGLGVPKDDPGAEARRQSLLVRARESELEAIRFVIHVADVKGWQ